MTPFLLEPGELMPIRNARFENFQIEGEGQRDFITLRPTVNQYMKVKKPGSIQGIVFKNIFLTGANPGPAQVVVLGASATNRVDGVLFDNVVRYGRKLDAKSENVHIGAFADHIRFGPEGTYCCARPGTRFATDVTRDRFLGWSPQRSVEGPVPHQPGLWTKRLRRGMGGAVWGGFADREE